MQNLKKFIWFFWRPYRIEINQIIETMASQDKNYLRWQIVSGGKIVKRYITSMDGFAYRCFGICAYTNIYFKAKEQAEAWALRSIKTFGGLKKGRR